MNLAPALRHPFTFFYMDKQVRTLILHHLLVLLLIYNRDVMRIARGYDQDVPPFFKEGDIPPRFIGKLGTPFIAELVLVVHNTRL